jgi:hypothetical protein
MLGAAIVPAGGLRRDLPVRHALRRDPPDPQQQHAAAISLSGAVLGFAMPIANVIAHSDTLLDLAVWGVIAGIVQLLAWGWRAWRCRR